jgi:multiple sugar transport system substrate-binding protein
VSSRAVTVLHGMTWDHPRGLASVRGAAAAYAALRPEVRVEWEARSLQGFADQPLEILARAYDLLVIDHPHIPHAANRGLLVALDTCGRDVDLAGLATRAVGPSHKTYAHAGHQYGLAIDAAAQVAVHRPDLLPVPPSTWDEVFELARTGRVVWPAKPVDAISSFLTLAASRGLAVAEHGFVARDAGLAILEHMHRLAELVDPACLDENPIQAAERLATDDRWCYAPLAFGYTNYSRAGFRRHRLAYVDMPAGPRGVAGSCLGGAGIAVSAFTPAPQLRAAVDHAFWLASGDVQRGVYYASGGQPANVAAWEDEALDADSLGFFRGTRRTLEGAWMRPRFDGWLQIQDEVGALINQALRGELGDSACLQAADRVVVRVLAEGIGT